MNELIVSLLKNTVPLCNNPLRIFPPCLGVLSHSAVISTKASAQNPTYTLYKGAYRHSSLQGIQQYTSHINHPRQKLYTWHNPLQTKRRPLYLKTHSVPRCKHISSGL